MKWSFWGFKQLEEVVFEGKVSYTDGVYYFNCPKLKTITLPSSYWESMLLTATIRSVL